MGGDRPGQEHAERGAVERSLSTAAHGNSRAFGFSITVTASFGVLDAVAGAAAGVGSALGVAEALGGGLGWPAGGFAAATVYMLAESAENLVAERVQHRRGDPQAESSEEE